MIDIQKHGREIGRHLAAGKFELTEGGVLVKAGMNALVNGAFVDTLYRNGEEDAQLSPNLVVNEGLIHLLNVYFAGTAAITAWYIGLFTNNANPSSGWNASNIVSNAGELEGYSPSTRPQFNTATVNAPSIGNAASQATFTFDDEGPYTARGAFLISSSTKGSTNGKLFAATRFAVDRTGLNQPDLLGVQYVVAAADAG